MTTKNVIKLRRWQTQFGEQIISVQKIRRTEPIIIDQTGPIYHVLQGMVINDSKHLLPAGWSSAYPEAVSLLAASTELGLPELPVDNRGLSTVTTGDEEPPSSRTSSALINTDGSALFTENLLAIVIERRLLPRLPQTIVRQLSQTTQNAQLSDTTDRHHGSDGLTARSPAVNLLSMLLSHSHGLSSCAVRGVATSLGVATCRFAIWVKLKRCTATRTWLLKF